MSLLLHGKHADLVLLPEVHDTESRVYSRKDLDFLGSCEQIKLILFKALKKVIITQKDVDIYIKVKWTAFKRLSNLSGENLEKLLPTGISPARLL